MKNFKIKFVHFIVKFFIIFTLIVINSSFVYSHSYIIPINPWDYQKMLGKGMDVDWAKTKLGMTFYNKNTVEGFRNRGVNHVRIRVKDDVTEELLNHLENIITDCISNDIIPIIAYQADDFKVMPNSENMNKVISWWTLVSNKFRDFSYKLSFDIMIECSDALNKEPDILNEMYEHTVSAIRKTNPYRIIFISPVVRSAPENLNLLKIPSEHNGYLMAEWHFYASGPSKTNEKKLWTIGTEEEKKLITDKINIALKWQKENNIPTWVGAWMPGNYNDGNNYSIEEQIIFSEFMRKSLDDANIPFAVNADTVFYDREKNLWIDEMMPVFYSVFIDYTHLVINNNIINLYNAEKGNNLIICGYNEKNLLKIKIININKENFSVNLGEIGFLNNNINIVKVLAWDNLYKMKPSCDSISHIIKYK